MQGSVPPYISIMLWYNVFTFLYQYLTMLLLSVVYCGGGGDAFEKALHPTVFWRIPSILIVLPCLRNLTTPRLSR
jgi:hypothetical protein